jgi:DNA-binding MarR family transcriptional regulator
MARPTTAGLPPATLLGDHTGYLLYRAGHLLIREVERHLEPLGLSGRTFFALTALHHLGPLSQQGLSQLFTLDPATVVALVDELEAANLVQRHRNTSDRRRYALALTSSGTTLLRRATEVVTRAEESFLGGLGPRQRATLHRSLTEILRDDNHA